MTQVSSKSQVVSFSPSSWVESCHLFPPKHCSISRIQSSWGERTRTMYLTVQKVPPHHHYRQQTLHSTCYVSSQVRSQVFNSQVEVESQVLYFLSSQDTGHRNSNSSRVQVSSGSAIFLDWLHGASLSREMSSFTHFNRQHVHCWAPVQLNYLSLHILWRDCRSNAVCVFLVLTLCS